MVDAAIRRASSRVSRLAAELGLLSGGARYTRIYRSTGLSALTDNRVRQHDHPTVPSLGWGGTPIPDRIVCRPNCRLCGVPIPPDAPAPPLDA